MTELDSSIGDIHSEDTQRLSSDVQDMILDYERLIIRELEKEALALHDSSLQLLEEISQLDWYLESIGSQVLIYMQLACVVRSCR
jgi:hypothetical protein